VLLVDNEPAILRGLSKLLSGRGYRVLTAQSGNAAVQIAAQEPVDAAIIDYHIPDWRGDVVLAAVAAYQPHLARRTVFMTGDLTDRVREVIGPTGCSLLIKPFEIEELEGHLVRLRSAVEGWSADGEEAGGA
jgi:CheY-like chemotaxis protein